MSELKQVCMYCGCHLGRLEAAPGDPTLISHGICAACLPTLLRHKGRPLSDFLDSLPGAIFVIDADCRVVGVNAQGLQQLSKDMAAVEGRLAGEVFECKFSKRPGGCGRTVHCKTCTIRITATKTYETGRACLRVPAFIDLADISKDMTIRFLISTEKVNDVIILRIDDVSPGDQPAA
jgi:hypothetical protein